jgi:hypothetical protein
MHALNRVSMVTGNPDFTRWAVELARTAHARFTYLPPGADRKRMYWKMSVDLTRPMVPSMGQHDPLDGLVTYHELQLAAARAPGQFIKPVLVQEIGDMNGICRSTGLATNDPLGIGGLLSDALRITRLTILWNPVYPGLLENVLDSALRGLEAMNKAGSLSHPARYRLAFRELGLSTGLAAIGQLPGLIGENPGLFDRERYLQQQVQALLEYVPLRERIEQFWLDGHNRETVTWTEHRAINTVMLATSLAPDTFLGV